MKHCYLIVDDSALTRAFIKKTLRMAGAADVELLEAADGAAALQTMHSRRVDLVLADLHMPGMDGAELARRILQDPRLKTVPIIVVSADPNTDRVAELKREGIAGYIGKPFTPEAFRDAVEPILRRAQ